MRAGLFTSLSARWGCLLFWLYLTILVVSYGTFSNQADPDLWHRFALLDHLWQTGHFPTGDTFNYQPDYQVLPDHEWGSSLVFYPVFFWGGGTSLVFLKLLLLGGTLALTVGAGLGRRSPTLLEAFFYSLVLLALLSSFLSTLRCEAFTHLFFALWLLWFQLERQGRKIPWLWYVLTMVIWANVHGGFLLGLLWLAMLSVLEGLLDRNWRRLPLLGLCLVATLINPFGYELWVGVYRALQVSRADFTEWSPVSWIAGYQFFLGYKVLVLWMLAVLYGHIRREGWQRCDRMVVILLGLFLIPSLEQERQTSIFAVIVGALLPPLFPPEKSLHDLQAWKPWLHRFAVRSILVVLPLVLAARLFPKSQGLHLVYATDNCPVGAVAYLHDQHVAGRLLVGFNDGSYALWELRGQMRVSMDGRYNMIYKPATFEKVQHFFAGTDDWRAALNEPVPDAVLVGHPNGVYAKMQAEPGWTEAYQDSAYSVFLPALDKKSHGPFNP